MTRYISGENGDQAPFDAFLGQSSAPQRVTDPIIGVGVILPGTASANTPFR